MDVEAPTSNEPARVARQRRMWTRRAPTWDHGDMPGLERIARAVLDDAGDTKGVVALDLGCGSGQLTLELASRAAKVTAVDISPRMLELLSERARAAGLTNIETVAAPLQDLALPPASVDLVVTNYALHHLRDPEKAALLANAALWLRPGGRIVVGDMMFGRGGEARDRQIIASKLVSIGRKGPAGWWRIAKNAWKFLVRREECPASMGRWVEMVTAAGFTDIKSRAVVAEAAVVSAAAPRRP